MKRVLLALAAWASITALSAQGTLDEGPLRALNTEALRLRGLLYRGSASENTATHARAAAVLAQRAALLRRLMTSQPRTALQLGFPSDVLADLAAAFPESADSIETRGTWQGTLYYFIEDGVGGTYHRESRKLKVGNQLLELYAASEVAGTKCNDVIAASGVLSGGQILAESSSLVANAAVPCSPIGAQNIAVILVNMPGFALPSNITPDYVKGILLGNAFTGSTSSTDWSVNDFWMQGSDGRTWVNTSGAGSATVVPVTLGSNYTYCAANGSDNSTAVRQAAYAAADGSINYNDYRRVVLVLPDNGSCPGTAGVGTVGCWSSECPGDGACNLSWAWWRADQIASRDWGVHLGTHEMGHNLGLDHAGSRAFPSQALGALGAAGTRSEYGDLFGTMGGAGLGLYNSQHSVLLGWLSSANVPAVTSNGTYSIQAFDTRPSNGVKALKIQRGTGNTTKFLYVSYYPNDPIYLNQLSAQIHMGAIIHYWDSLTPSGKTDLLDFNPSTAGDFNDAALASGQTWVDPYSDLEIGIGSIVNGTLTVNVTFGTVPCTAANPAVSMVTTTASARPGVAVNFTVNVRNQDSISCPSRTFNLSSSLPSDAGWVSSFAQANLTLGPGANANVTLTKTPPFNALGTYAVNAIATSGNNSGSSDPNNASVTVTPPGSVIGTLDAAGDAQGGAALVRGATLFVRGWAADTATGAPVQSVTVFVDGNNMGTATLGLARPDVASFYSRSDYTNSGWSLQMSTSALSVGAHTVSVNATATSGTVQLGSRTVTITQVQGQMIGALDVAGNAQGVATMVRGATLSVRGWAADTATGAPVQSVTVFVDGNNVGTATLGLARPDVASFYSRSDYANSGWSFQMSTSALSVGSHTVTAAAVGTSGTAQLGSRTVTITQAQAQGQMIGALDEAGNAQGVATVVRGATLFVRGWAADTATGAPVQSVTVFVDGNNVGTATLGLARPDVASFFSRADYTNSGWSFQMSTSALSAGSHTVTAAAVGTSGTAQVGSRTVTITQVQAQGQLLGSLDVAGNAQGAASLTSSATLLVNGWAADTAAGAPVQSVTVLVDGAIVGTATLGQARLDVASFFSRSDFTNSGWSFQMSASTLDLGTHTVTARAVGTSGTAQLGSRTVTIQ